MHVTQSQGHGHRAQSWPCEKNSQMLSPPRFHNANEIGEREHSGGGKAGATTGSLIHLIQAVVKRAFTDKTFTIESIIEMQLVCRSVLVGGLLSRVPSSVSTISAIQKSCV
jgi:hypothetical protein